MVQHNNSKYWMYGAAVIVAILLFLLFFMPITVKHDISGVARVIPAKEWLVQRANDGSLISSVKNYRSGYTENYFAVPVQRGDALQFNINPALTSKREIAKGDTIGFIRSNEIERRLAELKGNLRIASSSLAFYQSGEKEALIKQARSSDKLSREKADLQKRLFERQQMLYKKDLVSKEDIEIAESANRISQLEAELAVARLQTATTGAKPEQVRIVLAEIQRYESEIAVLEDRLDLYSLRSTINGNVYKSYAADTLLLVGEDKLLLMMPIPWSERQSVQLDARVTLTNEGTQTARIIRLDSNPEILNGEQVFTAIAELEESSDDLAPYLFSHCNIEAAEIPVEAYLKKLIGRMFAR